MAEWFESLNLFLKILIAIGGIGSIGGGSIFVYIMFRRLYYADVSVRETSAQKQAAEARKIAAEAEKVSIESIVIKDERSQKQTILSIDEVTTIVKNFGVQLQENAKLQESVHDAVLLADRRRTEIDELKGVVTYQRDEMREARNELREAILELGKCSGECNSRDEKINDLESRLRRAERTLRENNLLPDLNLNHRSTDKLPEIPT